MSTSLKYMFCLLVLQAFAILMSRGSSAFETSATE